MVEQLPFKQLMRVRFLPGVHLFTFVHIADIIESSLTAVEVYGDLRSILRPRGSSFH